MDLLSRLLAFDPTRRCSPDEALAHEYFADLAPSEGGEPCRGSVAGQDAGVGLLGDPRALCRPVHPGGE